MPTAAIKAYRTSLRASEALVRIEKRLYHDPPSSHETEAVQGLRGGAAVLMVAALEEYLRGLFREVVDNKLSPANNINFEKLPNKMQVQSVFSTLEDAMNASRDEINEPKVNRLERIRAAAVQVSSQQVNPQAFGQTANPGPVSVRKLFRTLGIPDIFAVIQADFQKKWLKAEHGTFTVDKLDEIVSRRHVVAHTADALNFSRLDLRDALHFLRVFGVCIEAATLRHLQQVRRASR